MTLDNLQLALKLNNEILLAKIKDLSDAISSITGTDLTNIKQEIKDLNDLLEKTKADIDSLNTTTITEINQRLDNIDTALDNIQNTSIPDLDKRIKDNLNAIKELTKSLSDLFSALDTHIKDTVIHVTQEDKDLWNSILDNAKKYAKKLFDSVTSFNIQIVDTLPVDNIKTMTIYFMRNGRDNESDYYEEYMYINNKWEIIGSTFVNLASYLLKADFEKYQQEIADKFAKYNTSDEIANILKDYLLTQTFNDTIKNYTTTEVLNKILEEYAKTKDIHTHENKTIIDKLSESADGNLLFNGQEIKGGSGSDITISEEDNNAIQQKDDGIFVEDKSEQIDNIQSKLDNINISKSNTKEKAFEEDILWEGSCTKGSINLSKSYQDYDELVFYLEYHNNNMYRPLYRIISPTLINKIRNSSIRDITVSMVWGYSNFNDYCNIQKTSTDTRLDIISRYITLVKVIGRKYNQIVIDPVEHINTSQGIEDTPVGHIISHMGNTAPKHYLICDGTEYNISDYPYLAQHFKNEFGSYNYFGGDGINTFAVPNLRGEFLRGTGTNSHTNQGSGVNVGEHQDATEIPKILLNSTYNNIYFQNAMNQQFSHFIKQDSQLNTSVGVTNKGYYVDTTGTFNATGETSHYTTRPTNTSVLYCIKYEPTYYMTVGEYTVQGFNDYSEEEKIVGRWIDGRPIYRKFVVCTFPSNESENILATIPANIDKIWINGGISFLWSDTYGMRPISFYYASGSYFDSWIDCTRGVIFIQKGNAYLFAGDNIYYALEYTKSTDAENSFTPDMLSTIVMSGNKQEDVTEEELNNLITDTINLLNE